jgi:hypothetical protein
MLQKGIEGRCACISLKKNMPLRNRALTIALLLCLIAFGNCVKGQQVQLNKINPPPPSGKLRIYLLAAHNSDTHIPNKWRFNHKQYESWLYPRVQEILTKQGIYDVVPREEIKAVIGSEKINSSELQKNDWALATKIGEKLYAEYAMIFERYLVTGSQHHKIVLINIKTSNHFSIVKRPMHRIGEVFVKKGIDEIFRKAQHDLIATAVLKGRVALKQINEIEQELQDLKQKPENLHGTIFDTDPNDTPATNAVSSKALVGRQKKMIDLEEKLSKLTQSLAELETLKKTLDKERSKSERLSKELEAKAQREKELLARVKDGSYHPPVIVTVSPKDDAHLEVDRVQIIGVAEDDWRIDQLEIFINDKPLKKGIGRGLKPTGKQPAKRVEFNTTVPIEKGKNTIKILATDMDGHFTEKILTVHCLEKRRAIWAVVIGINNYPHIRPLKYAVNDAELFYDYLIQYNHIPKENVTLLLNQEATLIQLRSTLGTHLKNKAGKEDMVIIFFAGHGATERDLMSPDGDGLEKYLLPYDVVPGDLYATALPMREISHIFKRIQSERLVFFADCCYSGASGGRTIGLSGTRANISEAFLERIASGKGRVIITASEANEVSTEKNEIQHGVFTYFLVEGLKGKADINRDGLVTVDEVYDYISKQVPQATGQEQHPVKKGTVKGQLNIGIVAY